MKSAELTALKTEVYPPSRCSTGTSNIFFHTLANSSVLQPWVEVSGATAVYISRVSSRSSQTFSFPDLSGSSSTSGYFNDLTLQVSLHYKQNKTPLRAQVN